MKLIDTIIMMNSNRPLWENLLKLVLLLWFAFTNGVAVYGAFLALGARKEVVVENELLSRKIFLTTLGVVGLIFFCIIALVCVVAMVFILKQIF